MIHTALSFFVEELNAYLQSIIRSPENKAVLSTYVNHEGSVVTTNQDKLCVTLVNLEQETTTRNAPAGKNAVGTPGRLNPTIKLNLYVLCAANFTDYLEALKFLSYTLAFFQGKNVFTPQNSPRLDAGFDKLIVELERTGYDEWSKVWGMLGGKYLPGVVYKLRMVPVQNERPGAPLPVISTIGQAGSEA
ncbi:DUF4255 domain-containing protein [Hymenobacter chitinivorans]|uniref:Uncharacterized protein DUF4255 n=1 Tax=Hymenobacter chitinivorans DSM 11115 TaxID=1121954 RepID=A0A2M9BS49_9BACT|nr:DUF4255 domain-containing protein [Hymenobacter chitinivorans]PJJ60773.1 uncharacterized protein DUF4255 [Hymenobacter chitinivorans DSM 11115]